MEYLSSHGVSSVHVRLCLVPYKAKNLRETEIYCKKRRNLIYNRIYFDGAAQP